MSGVGVGLVVVGGVVVVVVVEVVVDAIVEVLGVQSGEGVRAMECGIRCAAFMSRCAEMGRGIEMWSLCNVAMEVGGGWDGLLPRPTPSTHRI